MLLDPRTLAEARRGIRKLVRDHLFDPNVAVVDLGLRDGTAYPFAGDLSDLRVRAHVHQRLPRPSLRRAVAAGATRPLPETVDDFPVEVLQEDPRSFRCGELTLDHPGYRPAPGFWCPRLGMRVVGAGEAGGPIWGRVTGIEGVARIGDGQLDRIVRGVVTIDPVEVGAAPPGEAPAFWLDAVTKRPVLATGAGSFTPAWQLR